MEQQKLTVRLDADLLQRFKIVAVKERKSVSDLIREFVAFYVAKKETP
jgi:metal-responsive CopG/Arc/MetJ family transcriptional regulator